MDAPFAFEKASSHVRDQDRLEMTGVKVSPAALAGVVARQGFLHSGHTNEACSLCRDDGAHLAGLEVQLHVADFPGVD